MSSIIHEKIKTLRLTIKLFYTRYTKEVVTRDLLFIAVTVSEMIGITVAGKFLDATVQVIQDSETFDLLEYFKTDSFYYLCISLLLLMFVTIGNKVRNNLRNIFF